MRKQALLAPVLFLAACFSASGQGYSDAGAASIGFMKPILATDTANTATLLTGVSVGLADEDVVVISPFLEANFNLLPRTYLHLRAPFVFANGNLANTADMGDIFAGLSYSVWQPDSATNLRVMAIGKVAFNRADKRTDNFPLPMQYQTSTGTYDLIVGTTYSRKNWNLGIAYQHVLKNDNENNYLRDYVRDNEDYLKYLNARNLERAGDLVARVEYVMTRPGKLHQMTFGVVPVYHVGKDSYETISGKREDIMGSDGITVNLNMSFLYQLSSNGGLRLTFAGPFERNDVQPSGLGRKGFSMLNYEYRF